MLGYNSVAASAVEDLGWAKRGSAAAVPARCTVWANWPAPLPASSPTPLSSRGRFCNKLRRCTRVFGFGSSGRRRAGGAEDPRVPHRLPPSRPPTLHPPRRRGRPWPLAPAAPAGTHKARVLADPPWQGNAVARQGLEWEEAMGMGLGAPPRPRPWWNRDGHMSTAPWKTHPYIPQ